MADASTQDMLPIGDWVNEIIHFMLDHNAGAFDAIGNSIDWFANMVEFVLLGIPPLIMAASLSPSACGGWAGNSLFSSWPPWA